MHGGTQPVFSPHDLSIVALREGFLFLRLPCIPHVQMLLGGVLNHPEVSKPGLRKSWLKQTMYSDVDVDSVV